MIALVGLLWFLFAKDGLDEIGARSFGKDAIDDPVIAWFGGMRNAAGESNTEAYEKANGYLTARARNQLVRADIKAQREASGRIDRDRSLIDAFFGNPMMWSNVVAADLGGKTPPKLKIAVVDGDHARVAAPEGFVLRYARSGCVATDDSFTVERGPSGWRIAALPENIYAGIGSAGECTRRELRAAWRPAPSYGRGIQVIDTDGLPDWAGDRLQRAQPVGASAEPQSATAKNTASLETLPRATFDAENRSGPPEGITAWRTFPGRAIGTDLMYSLGAPVRLARIRLQNGVNNRVESDEYRGHGRIAAATLTTAQRSVTVALPDTPDLVTIDCDFGVTESVRFSIDAVFPADGLTEAGSDVALSDVSFWGSPPPKNFDLAAMGAPTPSETQPLPDLHMACETR